MRSLAHATALSLLVFVACGCQSEQPDRQASSALTLATTTSTQDSGLLDVLLPAFERETRIEVRVVAVGSGQALELGRRGDADVLLTHSPDDEDAFMKAGHGALRRTVMYNEFVLVGPPHDPARVREAATVYDAFRRIAEGQHPFVSRGDDSGTHRKELKIWELAAIEPDGDWYLQSGSGMAQTLRIASEVGAYTLSDISTFLFQKRHLSLEILFRGDPELRNRYSVIIVNPERHPRVRADLARRFADFLLEPRVQELISEYGRATFGQPLFHPASPQAPST